MEKRRKIEVMQAMRTFAALTVFLSHFFSPDEYALPGGIAFNGRFGVGIFFLLSGFLLVYTDRGGGTATSDGASSALCRSTT